MTTEVIADYTDFDYKKSFWGGENRVYEDICDRMAVRKLLPRFGGKIGDICGGFGRLIPEYIGKFSDIQLFDYAQNLLEQAKKEFGQKITTTQGSIYELPYQKNCFDVLVMVRASHHLQDFEKALLELKRVLKPGGKLIIEIANKRNVLEILRWVFGKSTMQPFSLATMSRNSKGFYNYHPAYVEGLFKKHNLKVRKVLGAALFRLPILKKVFGQQNLAMLESLLQEAAGLVKLSPSTYYLLEKVDA
jgi:ubiquinone/menaquinone biosynthesis C-methylase UbiE